MQFHSCWNATDRAGWGSLHQRCVLAWESRGAGLRAPGAGFIAFSQVPRSRRNDTIRLTWNLTAKKSNKMHLFKNIPRSCKLCCLSCSTVISLATVVRANVGGAAISHVIVEGKWNYLHKAKIQIPSTFCLILLFLKMQLEYLLFYLWTLLTLE